MEHGFLGILMASGWREVRAHAQRLVFLERLRPLY